MRNENSCKYFYIKKGIKKGAIKRLFYIDKL